MPRIRMPICALLLVAISASFFVDQSSAQLSVGDKMARTMVSICSEEIKHYAENGNISIGGENRFMIPQWQIYKYKNSVVLMLVVKHNFYWLDFYNIGGNGGLSNKSRTSQAILYGTYDKENGWVWYEKARLSALPQNRDEIIKEVRFMENGRPFGIINSAEESRRDIAIRYLCKKFINRSLFYVGGGM